MLPSIDTSQLTANQVANLNAQQAMNDNQSANSMALLNMQRQEAQRSEAIAALSTVMKNAHDSAMLVINNSKG